MRNDWGIKEMGEEGWEGRGGGEFDCDDALVIVVTR